MEMGLIPAVKKIAVLRANALGDFIVTLPAFLALRKAYPDSEIILLGKEWHKNFLAGRPSPIDRVIVVPPIRGISIPTNMAENIKQTDGFIKEMTEEKFDIVIQFMGNGIRANHLINRFNAKITAGFWSPEADPVDRYINFFYYQKEVLRYIEAVGLVGAIPVTVEPLINITSGDLTEAGSLIDLKQKYIIVHPGSNDIRRMWPAEKFAQVADNLIEAGYKVIITGTKTEEKEIRTLIKKSGYEDQIINLTDKLTIGGLAGLLSKSQLVISADTGPLHLARASGVKTVGIYWLPNLVNWGPTGNLKHRSCISFSLQCPLCGIIPVNPYPFEPQSEECHHLVSFVKDVSVQEVLENSFDLLS